MLFCITYVTGNHPECCLADGASETIARALRLFGLDACERDVKETIRAVVGT